jgi:hypothetical protein
MRIVSLLPCATEIVAGLGLPPIPAARVVRCRVRSCAGVLGLKRIGVDVVAAVDEEVGLQLAHAFVDLHAAEIRVDTPSLSSGVAPHRKQMSRFLRGADRKWPITGSLSAPRASRP